MLTLPDRIPFFLKLIYPRLEYEMAPGLFVRTILGLVLL